MYQENVGSRKTIGDIDIVFHEGQYHIFHLVLPNHDFIAHAVSDDGFSWSRVENAVFIGEPGSWDDSMLWTMHVTPDPWRPGRWRMFYTGIAQHDDGLEQRVGLAYSDDLFDWRKGPTNWISKCKLCRLRPKEPTSHTGMWDADSHFPIEATGPHYEDSLEQGRHWVSWRDPFYFHDGEQGRLLVNGRVPDGPVVRRGCVAQLLETGPGEFEAAPPLLHPGLYDDVEVPNLFRLDERYYLIGSIREDAKVRYWVADSPDGPWDNFADNVLLPKGNYAARISRDDSGVLLWNFFTQVVGQNTTNLVLPPKQLTATDNGELNVSSFHGFDERVERTCSFEEMTRSGLLWEGRACDSVPDPDDGSLTLKSPHGFQGFLLADEASSFRFTGRLRPTGSGKCGVLIRVDPESHDGYYLSLDLRKGLAQLRDWGTNVAATGEFMMRFRPLQSGYWRTGTDADCRVSLIAFGSYLEFSVNGFVVLSLADLTYDAGSFGFYAESVELQVSEMRFETLRPVSAASDTLGGG